MFPSNFTVFSSLFMALFGVPTNGFSIFDVDIDVVLVMVIVIVSLYLMWSRLAFCENAFCNSGTFFAKFRTESAIDDDINGRVDDLKWKENVEKIIIFFQQHV